MKWPTIRDIILFTGGLGGVAHETLIAHTERPTLLILFAAMMGLPAFLRPDAPGRVAEKAMQEEEESHSQKHLK